MTEISRDIRDVRHQFALRFEAIAKTQGLAVNGLLHLGDRQISPGKKCVTAEQPLKEPSICDELVTAPYDIHRQQTPCLIVPGLLGDSVRNLVAPMMCARKQLDCLGYSVKVAWVNGRTGCERNATALREQILREADSHGSAVDIIAYSKGCADSLCMLGKYHDTHDAVRSLVSLAGVVHGTPLAEDPPLLLRKLLQYFPLPGVPVGDGRAIVDMSHMVRQQWLAEHALPSSIYLASVVAAPSRSRVSRVLKGSYDKLASFSAANDSQVIDIDAMLPESDLLAIVNADHWAIALPVEKQLPLVSRFLVDQNTFPRNILLRAVIDHLAEMACKRRIAEQPERQQQD